MQPGHVRQCGTCNRPFAWPWRPGPSHDHTGTIPPCPGGMGGASRPRGMLKPGCGNCNPGPFTWLVAHCRLRLRLVGSAGVLAALDHRPETALRVCHRRYGDRTAAQAAAPTRLCHVEEPMFRKRRTRLGWHLPSTLFLGAISGHACFKTAYSQVFCKFYFADRCSIWCLCLGQLG